MKFHDWWNAYVDAAGGKKCQPSDIACAIAEAKPWLNAGLHKCSKRALTLLIELDKSRWPKHTERPDVRDRGWEFG